MWAQLLGFLLFACQITLNKSSVISENKDTDLAKVVTSTNTRPATLPAGYVTFSDVNAAYKVHEEETTWYEAHGRCMTEGAHLAIPDSVAKIVHINSLKTPSSKWLHVGIIKLNTNDQWIRVDNGLPVTFIPWIKDNPDDAGNCAGISVSKDGLVNYLCDWPGGHYVCEISIQGN